MKTKGFKKERNKTTEETEYEKQNFKTDWKN